MPIADIKNILACNLVCKTWSKILEACDDIWYNLFFQNLQIITDNLVNMIQWMKMK